MDSTSAPQPDTPTTPDELWRRFTLLDLLILFSGHEAALGIMKWYGLIVENGPLYPKPASPTVILVYLFFILGGVLSIPIVLFVQFYFRHRHEDAKGGEYFAVGHCILWVIVLFGIRSFPASDIVIPIMATTLVGLPIFIYGGCLFIKSVFVADKKAPCKWLGLYGYFLCFTSVVFFILGLI
jgi:hypothetical protein